MSCFEYLILIANIILAVAAIFTLIWGDPATRIMRKCRWQAMQVELVPLLYGFLEIWGNTSSVADNGKVPNERIKEFRKQIILDLPYIPFIERYRMRKIISCVENKIAAFERNDKNSFVELSQQLAMIIYKLHRKGFNNLSASQLENVKNLCNID